MSTSSKLTSSSNSSVYRSTPTSTKLSAYGSRKYYHKTSTRVSARSKSSSSNLPTRRPKTSASVCIGGRDNHSFLVAMIEGRGVATEVGMCFIDLRTSECILSQIADSQTYVKTLHKLNLYNPVEIVLSVTAIEPSKSKLCKILEDNMSMVSIVPIGRKYFNDTIGLNYIKQAVWFRGRFRFIDSWNNVKVSIIIIIIIISIIVIIHQLTLNLFRFYCLAATGALLKYIESTQNISFVNHSIKFKYQGCEGTMMIGICIQ
ncbi:hypothetical protein RclHR1_09340003 [Rhizophagus clarus]|uniref:DNA mismatch repair protein MutS connector domain-containing protein n=1 Tax=Rhizophagus clarus TaxID=94130 RepID=A0A2Z6S463_9GLOM|nr:hypothetical protein RclHR1_09340003 [Rhizophagus clarus]